MITYEAILAVEGRGGVVIVESVLTFNRAAVSLEHGRPRQSAASTKEDFMRHLRHLLIVLAVAAATLALGAIASGGGRSPAQLQRAGWDCLNPAAAFPANPNVHCFPPGELEAVVAGTAVSATLVTFATPDVNAEEAPFLGTEHMLRADHFHNQPCPTDPPGGPPGATRSPPLYTWSYLGPRFGWDYYICHTFDSPW